MPNNKSRNSKLETHDIQVPEVVSVKRRFWIPMLIAVLFLFVFGSALRVLANHFETRVYPNVFLGEYNLGGQTREEVGRFLASRFEEFERNGYQFSVGDDRVTLHSSVTALSDLDLTYSLYSVDEERTVDAVFSFGKQGSVMNRATKVLAQFFSRADLSAVIQTDLKQLTELLQQNFSSHERKVQEPTVVLRDARLGVAVDIEITHLDEPEGIKFEYEQAVEQFEGNLARLKTERIEIASIPDVPAVNSQEVLDPKNRILERLHEVFTREAFVFERPTSTVTEVVKEWKLSRGQFASFIGFEKDSQACDTCPAVRLALNQGFDAWVEGVTLESEVKVQDAKLIVDNGKIEEFQVSRDGLVLNTEALEALLEQELNGSGPFPEHFELPMEVVTPAVQTQDVNNLGIREIIGVGKSNFKGSPKNRRHNIAVGAKAVNGTLIPPGEEFSLLKVLGDISGATGYLPELVIKGDRTIPEYGGGLCQIGTTTFRGALASGLPITARKNHSYRVSYYEPAGTDATIYDPSPDFKFLNDTGHHILVQTRIEGDEVFFEYWGTKDSRTIEQTKPRIFNIVSPAPTKYIETLDLPPGKEKCTERAHAGADAEFTYTVTYPDGTVKEKLFESHYRPWQAVCLKGVKELSKPTEEVPNSQ